MDECPIRHILFWGEGWGEGKRPEAPCVGLQDASLVGLFISWAILPLTYTPI